MMMVKAFDHFADDDIKATQLNHSCKQTSLRKALRSTVISGTKIINWKNSCKISTLFHNSMKVESITKKNIVKGKSSTPFTGCLFYAIIPDNMSKATTFIILVPTFKKDIVWHEQFLSLSKILEI